MDLTNQQLACSLNTLPQCIYLTKTEQQITTIQTTTTTTTTTTTIVNM